MKKIILLLSVIVLAGCATEPPKHINGGENKMGNSDYDLNYFRDSRTGLCFAETGFGKTHTVTCVPCRDEVLKLIEGE